jgi:hypothetical protein
MDISGPLQGVMQVTWTATGPAGAAICAAVLAGLSWFGPQGMDKVAGEQGSIQTSSRVVPVTVIRGGRLERQEPIQPMAGSSQLATLDTKKIAAGANARAEIYASPAKVIAGLEDALMD